MQLITLIRALAWIAVVVTFWSVNIRWGSDIAVRAGAPSQFERYVMGAALLAATSAIALWFAHPTRPGRRIAGLIAVVCSAGAHGLAWMVRARAHDTGQSQLVDGSGWMWLVIGSGLAALAAVMALSLPAAIGKPRR